MDKTHLTASEMIVYEGLCAAVDGTQPNWPEERLDRLACAMRDSGWVGIGAAAATMLTEHLTATLAERRALLLASSCHRGPAADAPIRPTWGSGEM